MRCPGVSSGKAGPQAVFPPPESSVPSVHPQHRLVSPVASPVCSSNVMASALVVNSEEAKSTFFVTSLGTERPTV